VIFAVVDSEKNLLGIVHFNDIREIILISVKYTLVKNNEELQKSFLLMTVEMVMNSLKNQKSFFTCA
jgi:CIC family chloride channel protein